MFAAILRLLGPMLTNPVDLPTLSLIKHFSQNLFYLKKL